MSATASGSAAGILLVIAGVWLLLQTLVGNLPARIVGLGKSSSSTPDYGGGPLSPGGTKIGSSLTPAQKKQVQHQLGLN